MAVAFDAQALQTRIDSWRQRTRFLVDQIHTLDPYYVPTTETMSAARLAGQISYADIAAGRSSPNSRTASPYRGTQREEPSPSLSMEQTELHRPITVRPSIEQTTEGESDPSQSKAQQRETPPRQLSSSNTRNAGQSRRGRSPTRKPVKPQRKEDVHNVKNKDVPAVQIEVSNVQESSAQGQLTVTDSSPRSGLIPHDDTRRRSPSPMWIPGSTSYADILRGRMQAALAANMKQQANELREMVRLSARDRSDVSVDEHVSQEDNSRNDTETTCTLQEDIALQVASDMHLEADRQPYRTVAQIASATSVNMTKEPGHWANEPLNDYEIISTDVAGGHPQTEMYDYVHPMPELVGYINTQMGAYHVGSYVYAPGHQQIQQLEHQVPLNPYEGHVAYRNEHYVAQTAYLPTSSEIYQRSHEVIQQPQQQQKQEQQPQPIYELVDMVSEVTAPQGDAQVLIEQCSVVNASGEVPERISEVIEPSHQRMSISKEEDSPRVVSVIQETSNQSETTTGPSISYAKILSHGLPPQGTPLPSQGTSADFCRSHSPHEVTPPEAKMATRLPIQESMESQPKKSKERDWDTIKKKDSKKKPYSDEKDKREEDKVPKDNKKTKKSAERPIIAAKMERVIDKTNSKPQKSNEANNKVEKQILPPTLLDDSTTDNTQEKKRKQKKKKQERSDSDEIDKALKEIEDMDKQQKTKSQKDKTKESTKTKENAPEVSKNIKTKEDSQSKVNKMATAKALIIEENSGVDKPSEVTTDKLKTKTQKTSGKSKGNKVQTQDVNIVDNKERKLSGSKVTAVEPASIITTKTKGDKKQISKSKEITEDTKGVKLGDSKAPVNESTSVITENPKRDKKQIIKTKGKTEEATVKTEVGDVKERKLSENKAIHEETSTSEITPKTKGEKKQTSKSKATIEEVKIQTTVNTDEKLAPVTEIKSNDEKNLISKEKITKEAKDSSTSKSDEPKIIPSISSDKESSNERCKKTVENVDGNPSTRPQPPKRKKQGKNRDLPVLEVKDPKPTEKPEPLSKGEPAVAVVEKELKTEEKVESTQSEAIKSTSKFYNELEEQIVFKDENAKKVKSESSTSKSPNVPSKDDSKQKGQPKTKNDARKNLEKSNKVNDKSQPCVEEDKVKQPQDVKATSVKSSDSSEQPESKPAKKTIAIQDVSKPAKTLQIEKNSTTVIPARTTTTAAGSTESIKMPALKIIESVGTLEPLTSNLVSTKSEQLVNLRPESTEASLTTVYARVANEPVVSEEQVTRVDESRTDQATTVSAPELLLKSGDDPLFGSIQNRKKVRSKTASDSSRDSIRHQDQFVVETKAEGKAEEQQVCGNLTQEEEQLMKTMEDKLKKKKKRPALPEEFVKKESESMRASKVDNTSPIDKTKSVESLRAKPLEKITSPEKREVDPKSKGVLKEPTDVVSKSLILKTEEFIKKESQSEPSVKTESSLSVGKPAKPSAKLPSSQTHKIHPQSVDTAKDKQKLDKSSESRGIAQPKLDTLHTEELIKREAQSVPSHKIETQPLVKDSASTTPAKTSERQPREKTTSQQKHNVDASSKIIVKEQKLGESDVGLDELVVLERDGKVETMSYDGAEDIKSTVSQISSAESVKPYWINHRQYAEAESDFYKNYTVIKVIKEAHPSASVTRQKSSSIERIVQESVMKEKESEEVASVSSSESRISSLAMEVPKYSIPDICQMESQYAEAMLKKTVQQKISDNIVDSTEAAPVTDIPTESKSEMILAKMTEKPTKSKDKNIPSQTSSLTEPDVAPILLATTLDSKQKSEVKEGKNTQKVAKSEEKKLYSPPLTPTEISSTSPISKVETIDDQQKSKPKEAKKIHKSVKAEDKNVPAPPLISSQKTVAPVAKSETTEIKPKVEVKDDKKAKNPAKSKDTDITSPPLTPKDSAIAPIAVPVMSDTTEIKPKVYEKKGTKAQKPEKLADENTCLHPSTSTEPAVMTAVLVTKPEITETELKTDVKEGKKSDKKANSQNKNVSSPSVSTGPATVPVVLAIKHETTEQKPKPNLKEDKTSQKPVISEDKKNCSPPLTPTKSDIAPAVSVTKLETTEIKPKTDIKEENKPQEAVKSVSKNTSSPPLTPTEPALVSSTSTMNLKSTEVETKAEGKDAKKPQKAVKSESKNTSVPSLPPTETAIVPAESSTTPETIEVKSKADVKDAKKPQKQKPVKSEDKNTSSLTLIPTKPATVPDAPTLKAGAPEFESQAEVKDKKKPQKPVQSEEKTTSSLPLTPTDPAIVTTASAMKPGTTETNPKANVKDARKTQKPEKTEDRSISSTNLTSTKLVTAPNLKPETSEAKPKSEVKEEIAQKFCESDNKITPSAPSTLKESAVPPADPAAKTKITEIKPKLGTKEGKKAQKPEKSDIKKSSPPVTPTKPAVAPTVSATKPKTKEITLKSEVKEEKKTTKPVKSEDKDIFLPALTSTESTIDPVVSAIKTDLTETNQKTNVKKGQKPQKLPKSEDKKISTPPLTPTEFAIVPAISAKDPSKPEITVTKQKPEVKKGKKSQKPMKPDDKNISSSSLTPTQIDIAKFVETQTVETCVKDKLEDKNISAKQPKTVNPVTPTASSQQEMENKIAVELTKETQKENLSEKSTEANISIKQAEACERFVKDSHNKLEEPRKIHLVADDSWMNLLDEPVPIDEDDEFNQVDNTPKQQKAKASEPKSQDPAKENKTAISCSDVKVTKQEPTTEVSVIVGTVTYKSEDPQTKLVVAESVTKVKSTKQATLPQTKEQSVSNTQEQPAQSDKEKVVDSTVSQAQVPSVKQNTSTGINLPSDDTWISILDEPFIIEDDDFEFLEIPKAETQPETDSKSHSNIKIDEDQQTMQVQDDLKKLADVDESTPKIPSPSPEKLERLPQQKTDTQKVVKKGKKQKGRQPTKIDDNIKVEHEPKLQEILPKQFDKPRTEDSATEEKTKTTIEKEKKVAQKEQKPKGSAAIKLTPAKPDSEATTSKTTVEKVVPMEEKEAAITHQEPIKELDIQLNPNAKSWASVVGMSDVIDGTDAAAEVAKTVETEMVESSQYATELASPMSIPSSILESDKSANVVTKAQESAQDDTIRRKKDKKSKRKEANMASKKQQPIPDATVKEKPSISPLTVDGGDSSKSSYAGVAANMSHSSSPQPCQTEHDILKPETVRVQKPSTGQGAISMEPSGEKESLLNLTTVESKLISTLPASRSDHTEVVLPADDAEKSAQPDGSWAAIVAKNQAESLDSVPIVDEKTALEKQTLAVDHQVQIVVEEVPEPEPIENIVQVDAQGFMEFVNRRELRSRRSRSRSRSSRREDKSADRRPDDSQNQQETKDSHVAQAPSNVVQPHNNEKAQESVKQVETQKTSKPGQKIKLKPVTKGTSDKSSTDVQSTKKEKTKQVEKFKNAEKKPVDVKSEIVQPIIDAKSVKAVAETAVKSAILPEAMKNAEKVSEESKPEFSVQSSKSAPKTKASESSVPDNISTVESNKSKSVPTKETQTETVQYVKSVEAAVKTVVEPTKSTKAASSELVADQKTIDKGKSKNKRKQKEKSAVNIEETKIPEEALKAQVTDPRKPTQEKVKPVEPVKTKVQEVKTESKKKKIENRIENEAAISTDKQKSTVAVPKTETKPKSTVEPTTSSPIAVAADSGFRNLECLIGNDKKKKTDKPTKVDQRSTVKDTSPSARPPTSSKEAKMVPAVLPEQVHKPDPSKTASKDESADIKRPAANSIVETINVKSPEPKVVETATVSLEQTKPFTETAHTTTEMKQSSEKIELPVANQNTEMDGATVTKTVKAGSSPELATVQGLRSEEEKGSAPKLTVADTSETKPKSDKKSLSKSEASSDLVHLGATTGPEAPAEPRSKVHFYIDEDDIVVVSHDVGSSKDKIEEGEEEEVEDATERLSRYISLDSGFWLNKRSYHEAERNLFESLAALSKPSSVKKETIDSNDKKRDRDDDSHGGNSGGEGERKNDSNIEANSNSSTPRTERLVADLPGGMCSWNDYSTYLAIERDETHVDSTLDHTSQLVQRMTEDLITDLDSPDSGAQLSSASFTFSSPNGLSSNTSPYSSIPTNSSSTNTTCPPLSKMHLGIETGESGQQWSNEREVERETESATAEAKRIQGIKVRQIPASSRSCCIIIYHK